MVTKTLPRTLTLPDLISRFIQSRRYLSPKTVDYYQVCLGGLEWFAVKQHWPDPDETTREHIRDFMEYVATEPHRWAGDEEYQEVEPYSDEEVALQEGGLIKVITDVQTFLSHEEAVAYISGQESESYRIVSDNPFGNPVPLDAVEDYRLIHSSGEEVVIPGIGITVPEVKIFEYIGGK